MSSPRLLFLCGYLISRDLLYRYTFKKAMKRLISKTGKVGSHTKQAIGSAAGALAGGIAGAKVGAMLEAIGGPVGILVGGIAGGIIVGDKRPFDF